MEQSVVTAVFLPLALGVIMLGLGLSLTIEDFKRVVIFPKAVLVGLACQMLLLPAVCYFIAKGTGLPPEFAVGLMLLAASPGGGEGARVERTPVSPRCADTRSRSSLV